jgi:hypothetical protein
MSTDDRSYFEHRAEMELEMAQRAEHPEAVRAHYLMAGLYLDKIHAIPGSDAAEGVCAAERLL